MLKKAMAAGYIIALWVSVGIWAASAQTHQQGTDNPAADRWRSQEVDWSAGGGRRIKAIRSPKDGQPRSEPKRPGSVGTASASSISVQASTGDIQIDSPPVAGFTPHIAVAVTDKRSSDDDWVAQTHSSVAGRYLTNNPETDYTVGLFDTGAVTHVMSHAAAQRTGVFAAKLVTTHTVELLGATNSVSAWVSHPLALFMDGLAAIQPDGTLDDSNMVGQSNVAIVIADDPGAATPDLPTAIGSPMSVNFVAAIYNDHPISVTYDGNDYTGPDIRFYEQFDSRIPDYEGRIPLNLIPAGAVNIQYIPDFEALFELIFEPGQPSVIVGNSAQSLFFVDSVDLHQGTRSALDKRRFMLDTGAQVTIIGSGIGSRLGLNPADPDFEVEIQDITGEITMQPAFFIDSLEIPALGGWLTYSNAPVILMDIDSPEGGYLEGIIGMNLFVEFNLVLQGGGMLGQDIPFLMFERISLPPVGDIAPASADGIVNFLDVAALGAAWLSSEGDANWNPRADLFPRQLPDGIVDNNDLSVFAAHWRETMP